VGLFGSEREAVGCQLAVSGLLNCRGDHWPEQAGWEPAGRGEPVAEEGGAEEGGAEGEACFACRIG